MTSQEQHHDLALMLLVGRSLPSGLPWPLNEDQAHILLERVLWTSLTPEQQQTEQQFLAEFWKAKGAKREIKTNPSWGLWTSKLPATISIPDQAFGLSDQGFRPWLKGSWANVPAHKELAYGLQWLWSRGFQVAGIDLGGQRSSVILVIPVTRLIQESERLMNLIGTDFGTDVLGPWGAEGRVWIRSLYDPISGQASIEVEGLFQL